ncbi:hypothetical protein AGMMS49579_07760 [Spirochaetia bacterium]|nr:hypothetical protein AGMMS49579_07760 [Spirochaetia bacterium]
MNQNINKYRDKLKNIIEYGGSLNETTIRRCFIDLVYKYQIKNFHFLLF